MTGRIRKRGIRIAYVGPNMDLAMAAYVPHHQTLGHEVEYYLSPDHLPIAPPPDVVVIAPLITRNGRIEGPCLLSQIVPATTLVVALATAEGNSHSMFMKHALEGRCHKRILVHYPRPGFKGEDFVDRLDAAAHTSGSLANTMCGLPSSLDLPGAVKDLGQVMDDPTLTNFLYLAATDPGWSTWHELASKLGYSEGTVKNRMSKFGRHASDAGLIPRKLDPNTKYRAGEFVRYVTEHRSFIQAYSQHRNVDTQSDDHSVAETAADNGTATDTLTDNETHTDSPTPEAA